MSQVLYLTGPALFNYVLRNHFTLDVVVLGILEDSRNYPWSRDVAVASRLTSSLIGAIDYHCLMHYARDPPTGYVSLPPCVPMKNTTRGCAAAPPAAHSDPPLKHQRAARRVKRRRKPGRAAASESHTTLGPG